MAARTILITGATGAIGEALAVHYAGEGVRLYLQGRDEKLLEGIAGQCRARGAWVNMAVLDLTHRQALEQWCDRVLKSELPDLVFANAGMNIDIGPEKSGESWGETEQLIELNIRSSIYLVHRFAREMREQKRGHLILMSSLAAWFGLPHTPAYSASKAALKVYGEAIRGWLAPDNVQVTVVMPGYVSSPMCHAMPGPKPFLLQPEKAAQYIAKGVYKKKARVTFPSPLDLGTWILAVVPASLAHRLVKWFGYGV